MGIRNQGLSVNIYLFKKMNLLAQGFLVEGVGIGNTNFDAFKKNIAVILDNFARAIYTVVSAQ